MRVVCFTAGSANLFSMIPVCGWLIALVYTIVLECIGLARAHETTTGKALIAVLLPIFLCCCVMGILIAAIFGSLGAFAEYFNQHH
jgi:ABC-type molybdate transport system permease subunit